MTDVELLDKAIQICSNGKQLDFVEYSGIKNSTIKTWRTRELIPDDKILLLKTLIENHELKQQEIEFAEYFRLQAKFTKKFQN